MAQIIDGKELAEKLRKRITEEAALLPRKPGFAIMLVGDRPDSKLYVDHKVKDCEGCGFYVEKYALPSGVGEGELKALIGRLNADTRIDGVLAQLPLPEGINEESIIEAIDPAKDVDALHPMNIGKLLLSDPLFLPCTAAGILEMLHAYKIPVAGKNCVVVGRSKMVGKPMALLLLRENGTVTVCHTQTNDLAENTRKADVLVIAAGSRGLVTGDMVKEGAAVIDVAMNRDEEGRFCGDAVFDEVSKKASYITPVPGGVGPMTRAILLRNIFISAKRRQGL